MYFQHDGVPPHFSREVRNFLNYRFPGRWIGCGGPHNWPARFPYLSPLHWCVWGWMEKLVYSVKVGTRDASLGPILDAADRFRNSQRKLQRATRTVHNRAAACVADSAQWGIWAIWPAKSRFSKNQRRWNTKLPDKDEQCQNKRLPLLSPSAPHRRHTVSRNWAFAVGARIFAERSVRKRALKVNICCRVIGRNT